MKNTNILFLILVALKCLEGRTGMYKSTNPDSERPLFEVNDNGDSIDARGYEDVGDANAVVAAEEEYYEENEYNNYEENGQQGQQGEPQVQKQYRQQQQPEEGPNNNPFNDNFLKSVYKENGPVVRKLNLGQQQQPAGNERKTILKSVQQQRSPVNARGTVVARKSVSLKTGSSERMESGPQAQRQTTPLSPKPILSRMTNQGRAGSPPNRMSVSPMRSQQQQQVNEEKRVNANPIGNRMTSRPAVAANRQTMNPANRAPVTNNRPGNSPVANNRQPPVQEAPYENETFEISGSASAEEEYEQVVEEERPVQNPVTQSPMNSLQKMGQVQQANRQTQVNRQTAGPQVNRQTSGPAANRQTAGPARQTMNQANRMMSNKGSGISEEQRSFLQSESPINRQSYTPRMYTNARSSISTISTSAPMIQNSPSSRSTKSAAAMSRRTIGQSSLAEETSQGSTNGLIGVKLGFCDTAVLGAIANIRLMGLKYPRLASTAERQRSAQYVTSIVENFPCDREKQIMKQIMNMSPPIYSDRAKFNKWAVLFGKRVLKESKCPVGLSMNNLLSPIKK